MIKKVVNSVGAFALVTLTSGLAFAEDAAAAGSDWTRVAIALAIGLAVIAGTTSQARTASAALEGIARNPNAADKLFVPMILGLAFIESLVLFAWLMFVL